jgi:hypothetical protein
VYQRPDSPVSRYTPLAIAYGSGPDWVRLWRSLDDTIGVLFPAIVGGEQFLLGSRSTLICAPINNAAME